MRHPWYWAIQAKGGGPDYFLTLSFASQVAGTLLPLVSQHLLTGFERVSRGEAWLQARRQTHPELQVWISVPASEWKGNLILVCESALQLERLGGGDEAHDPVEDELLATLAQVPLPLTQWHLIGGGRMYASRVYAEGTTWEEFQAYRTAYPDAVPPGAIRGALG